MLAARHGDTLAACIASCRTRRHYHATEAARLPAVLILTRSYLGEILRHLSLVLAGVIFLLALGAAVKASSTAQGAPVWVVLTLVPLFVGNALPYFFPVGLMTAVVLTYGRMAADREEVALRAAGEAHAEANGGEGGAIDDTSATSAARPHPTDGVHGTAFHQVPTDAEEGFELLRWSVLAAMGWQLRSGVGLHW